MPDFDESVFDAMTDEQLADYLAHDAELPLSFVRSAEAVLYAATLLALRRPDALPDPGASFESFQNDYLPVPFDGGTLWDDRPRYAAAPKSTRPAQAVRTPASQVREFSAAPELPPAAASAPDAAPEPSSEPSSGPLPAPAAPPPLPELSAPPAPAFYAAPAAPPRRGGLGGLLVVLLIIALAGLAFLFISSTFRTMLGGSSPSAEASNDAGRTLTWVPAGYSSADFSDWDVSGYLYTWKDTAGDTITFCRYHRGTQIAVDQRDASVDTVAVCGVTGEYTRRGREHSLVFTDADDGSVYYLDAGNVSDADMKNMIAAIK